MTTKREFFDNLHKQLAEKYQLTSRQISTIRSWSIGYKKTRKEIAEWTVLKLQQSQKPYFSIHFQTLLNFIASCSSEAWNDITQLTEFDKGERGADNPPSSKDESAILHSTQTHSDA
jgi:hypothetical protein